MGKAHGQQYAFRGRLGMNFKGEPFILNGEFFFQLVDNALADIAEGSYIVGKYAHLYGHGMNPSFVFSTRQATYEFACDGILITGWVRQLLFLPQPGPV